ncbi:hypothetical protein [Sphingomonas koreensis]|nr:hypothetical protein [Sphingomonas koreensis]
MAGFYTAALSKSPALQWPGLSPPCTQDETDQIGARFLIAGVGRGTPAPKREPTGAYFGIEDARVAGTQANFVILQGRDRVASDQG